jgi:hypothetical protein
MLEENKSIEPAVIGPGKMSPAELRSYINERAVKLAEAETTSVEDLMSNPTFLEYKAALDQIMSLEGYYGRRNNNPKPVDKKKIAKARKKNKVARKQRKINSKK